MPGERRRARQIMKSTGRKKTIKATNKNRGRGTSKAKSRNTICNKWGCRPKRKTRVRSKARTGRNRGKDDKKSSIKTKYTTSKTTTTPKITTSSTYTPDPQKSKNPRFL